MERHWFFLSTWQQQNQFLIETRQKGGSSKLSSSKYWKFSTLGIKGVLAARGIREKDVVM